MGAIDFGYVGEAPAVFAQVAGPNFVYTAYEIPTPRAEGILVHRETPIKTQADQSRSTKVPMFIGYSSQHYGRAA
ncbi:ABC-type nitrate/sulfonate/bicarbonate transport system substrate-binding protein [Paraburkholderia terricola]|nr:ABC-type nitrate/sulfonate/bicarbonate transport system substrate-binding protein [Paraburkholderia terricola]MDR6492551.1 ABC-type nitrate/sulfonate/bicarbonate transport system substrate-binding protein [Paraburkholderia terricola]